MGYKVNDDKKDDIGQSMVETIKSFLGGLIR
jgi:hypothetical protein